MENFFSCKNNGKYSNASSIWFGRYERKNTCLDAKKSLKGQQNEFPVQNQEIFTFTAQLKTFFFYPLDYGYKQLYPVCIELKIILAQKYQKKLCG